MKRIKGMAISVTEMDGVVDVGIAVQDAGEGLAPCVGTTRMLVDTNEDACCILCWVKEIAELIMEGVDGQEWTAHHGADCEGGEDVVGHP